MGHEGAPPVAESSDRNGWAAACLGASEAQREGLAATRGSQATEAVGQALPLPSFPALLSDFSILQQALFVDLFPSLW